MRFVVSRWAGPVAMLCTLVGCLDGGDRDGAGGESTTQTGGDGAGQQGGAGGTGGSGGSGAQSAGGNGGEGAGGPGEIGWTIVPLIDDATVSDDVIYHPGNSLVTGIHFSALDAGIVTVAGDNGTFSDGGAIFGATQSVVTDVRYRGDGSTALCLLGTVDFTGIEKTSSGYIAMAHACDLIRSVDGGDTFGVEPVGVGDPFGIEDVLAFQERDGGHTLVRDTGVVSVTSDPIGQNAIWDDRWAPQGVPSTPDPVPADQCQRGPQSNNVPARRQAVYVRADGDFVAYSSQEGDEELAAVCVSTDGGTSFFPTFLPVTGEDAIGFAPSGVHFTSATDGIVWWANYLYEDQAYVMRTTDGGETWSEVALPAAIAGKGIEMNGAFFAPDGQHGWIVGYNYDNSIALMIRTTDGGASWDALSGDLAAKVGEAGGSKLFTGFALDANHIWVGGEYGVLMSNSAGGL